MFFHCPRENSPVVQIVWSRKTCFLRGMSNMPTLPDVTFGHVLLSKKHGIYSSSMILFLVGPLFCTASLQNVDMLKSHRRTHWFLIFRWTVICRKTLANLGAWLGPRSNRKRVDPSFGMRYNRNMATMRRAWFASQEFSGTQIWEEHALQELFSG